MCKNSILVTLLAKTFFLLSFNILSAQETKTKEKQFLFSVFNSGTQLPSSLITQPIHPGFNIGLEFALNRSLTNQWFQTAKLGLLHHQYVQTAMQLYTENGYRRKVWNGLFTEFRIGAGYLHSFSDVAVYRINDNGEYNRSSRLGRPQIMVGGALGIGHTFHNAKNPWRLQLEYQFFLQTPFVKQYVPLLPVTAAHLGGAFPLAMLTGR
jgi:hypothetical protein